MTMPAPLTVAGERERPILPRSRSLASSEAEICVPLIEAEPESLLSPWVSANFPLVAQDHRDKRGSDGEFIKLAAGWGGGKLKVTSFMTYEMPQPIDM